MGPDPTEWRPQESAWKVQVPSLTLRVQTRYGGRGKSHRANHSPPPSRQTSEPRAKQRKALRRKRNYQIYSPSSTLAACPSGFTFSKIFSIFPSASIKNVDRSTPIYFFPYMLFSFHTPYASATA